MQFLAVIGLAIVGVFLGTFLVSGLSASIKDVSHSFPTNYGYTGTSIGERLQARKAATQGKVAGASIVSSAYAEDGIISTLADLKNVSRFQSMFTKANGASYMTAPTLYTLFVPTDEAFHKLPYATQVELNTMNAEELERFVTYNMVPQKMMAVGLQKAGVIPAISRDYLNFELNDTGGTVGNANVVAAYNVSNGIIYVVDEVLLPPVKRVENIF